MGSLSAPCASGSRMGAISFSSANAFSRSSFLSSLVLYSWKLLPSAMVMGSSSSGSCGGSGAEWKYLFVNAILALLRLCDGWIHGSDQMMQWG